MSYCICCGNRRDGARMCPNCKKREKERLKALKDVAKNRASEYDVSSTRGAGQVPDVSVDFVLVEHGYQMDLYVDGKLEIIECRDFGGDHRIPDLRLSVVQALTKAVNLWRKKH